MSCKVAAQMGGLVALDQAIDSRFSPDESIRVLRVASRHRALAIVQSAERLFFQGRIKFLLLELAPSMLSPEGAVSLLRLLMELGMNVFSDSSAEEGALEPKELEAFVAGVGTNTQTIFAARSDEWQQRVLFRQRHVRGRAQ